MRHLSLLFIWLLMPLTAIAEPTYLRHEHLPLPMDGNAVSTSLPLDPTREYKVLVMAQHSLRPLFAGRCKEIKHWFSTDRECALPITFNGATLPSRTSHTKELAGYFYDTGESAFYVPTLDFRFWGNGRPLLLRTLADFSYAIPRANVEIIDMVDQADEEKRIRQEQQRQEEQARRAQAERERQARAQEAERVRVALAQEEEEAARREAGARVQELRQRQQDEEARQERLIARHDQLQNALEQHRTQFAQLQPQYLQEQASAERAQRLRHMVTVAIIVLIATSIMGLTPRLRAWQARQAEQRAAQQRAVLDEMLMDIERVKQARDTLHHLHKETSP